MTAWELFAVAAHRWVVTLTCGLLTVLAVAWVLQAQPVYFVQVRVVLLAPTTAEQNGLATTSTSLINLAGAVARGIQGSSTQARAVSDEVTLVGEGVRDGFLVQQPSVGGQWEYSFQEPVLNVQAVGETRDAAQARMQEALDLVTASLTRLEDAEAVPEENRVRVNLSPAVPQITEHPGSQTRAVAAVIVIGVAATLAVSAALGPRRPRRDGRRNSPRPVPVRIGKLT